MWTKSWEWESFVRCSRRHRFNGQDANGAWTLFIADVSPVGIGTLENWSLTIDGNGPIGVPDGGATFGLLGMGLAGIAAFRQRLALSR